MPRKYTKRSDYLKKFGKEEAGASNLEDLMSDSDSVVPATAGESYYTEASITRNVNQVAEDDYTRLRGNSQTVKRKTNKFKNVSEMSMPYSYGKNSDYISPRSSISLCQKAYANVPIFRNAVDVMAEFANSDLYLDGGSEKSRTFIDKWLNRIESWKLKDQYFREYYRSGNVFIYKISGKFNSEDLIKLNQVYGSESKIAPNRKIPVKYVFLNPYDFVAERTLTFGEKNGVYKKLLSEYDLERLKNPKTDYDKEVFDALPDEVKEKISSKSYMTDGVKVFLDSEKLIYSFYKKQDYEPFAVPFGFPVLDDINWKMELKKVDQAITRTIENVILLVTMGNTPDKGGVNPNNLKAMQDLFRNESIGRALIADYTTKAEFIIPDLNKVLGPTKYQIVNEDIKEGLQNIIVGKENYSSTQVKAQIFLERLKEARNAFLNDVLQPQIKSVCKVMGFRNFPTAKFVEIDIKDEVQLQRVASRLIEMGIITPEQGMTAIKQGIYPNPEELSPAQEKFVEDREKGYYTPLTATQPILSEDDQKMKEEAHDMQMETQKTAQKVAKNPPQQNQDPKQSGGPKERGRPAGTNTKTDKVFASDTHSRKDIQDVVYAIEGLQKFSEQALRKHYDKKRLSKEQKEMVLNLSQSVVMSKDISEWENEVQACIEDFNNIENLDVMSDILDLSQKHEITSYPAAILYHSKKINDNK